MSEKPESPRKKLALWQWGLLAIFGGVAANLMMGMQQSGGSSATARGEALGRGVAALLFIVVGLTLIVIHFIRRKRG
jgi:hypothetical protein